jgi:hypothetical protein
MPKLSARLVVHFLHKVGTVLTFGRSMVRNQPAYLITWFIVAGSRNFDSCVVIATAQLKYRLLHSNCSLIPNLVVFVGFETASTAGKGLWWAIQGLKGCTSDHGRMNSDSFKVEVAQ